MPVKSKKPESEELVDLLLSASAGEIWSLSAPAMFEGLGLRPDPWQNQLFKSRASRVLLCCSRQSGKTTTTTALALHGALFSKTPQTILVFAPTGRQADELLHKLFTFYRRLGKPVKQLNDKVSMLELADGSRIIPLPNNEEAIRGFSPDLVIIDEAARVPDALYKAIRPMLAVTRGRLIAMSTPFGKRGWFYEEWIGTGTWERIRVTANECPRISREFLEDEKRALGEIWYRQEYECSFEMMAGLVYPDFEKCLVEPSECENIRKAQAVGGLDFGFHNPSAYLNGILDTDDILWITEEIYGSRMTDDDLILKVKPLTQHHGTDIIYADPEAAGSIEKFRRADLPVRKAMKKIDLGIRAVTARINTGRLKVSKKCKNLIHEAGLYRYHTAEEQRLPTDKPVKEFDHAADALRYMICGVDRVREVVDPEKPRLPTEEKKESAKEEEKKQRPDWLESDRGWEEWR
jgi:hypothetical protein